MEKKQSNSIPMAGLNVLSAEKNASSGLALRAIPYIGQYGENYRWLPPLIALKPDKINIIKMMPANVQNAAKAFVARYPAGEIDFFVINHSAADLLDECVSKGYHNDLRFNYVVHPYVFYDCQKRTHHKSNVYMSLYKINEDDPVNYSHEPGCIPINAPDILSNDCLREVYAHPFENTDIMCISPNNAAFRLAFTRPVVSFFGCCVVTYMKDYGRLMIALHTVILDWRIPLTEHLLPLIEETRLAIVHGKQNDGGSMANTYAKGALGLYFLSGEYVRRAFGLAAEELLLGPKGDKIKMFEDVLHSLGMRLFRKHYEPDKSSPRDLLMSTEFVRNFYRARWTRLIETAEPEKFARSYLADLPLEFYAKLLCHYMQDVIQMFHATALLHNNLLRDDAGETEARQKIEAGDYVEYLVMEDVLKSQEKLYPPNELIQKASVGIENPDLTTMKAHLDLILNDEMELAAKKFEELSPTLRNVVFYRTWGFKGRPMGTHPNFGQLSYLGDGKKLGGGLIMSREEKVELLTALIGELTKLDTTIQN